MKTLDPTNCQTEVYDSGGFFGHQCLRKPTVTRNGKLYCKIHDPEYLKAKGAERDAKWQKESAQRQAGYALDKARHLAFEGLTLEELKKVTPTLIRQRILGAG